MPTRRLIRFWCHTCKEFTLQEIEGGCLTCGTINESYSLSEVPEEKVEEQRERYSAQQKAKIWNPYSIFQKMAVEHPGDLLGPVEVLTEIVEDDAGQKEIDKARKEYYDKLFKEREKLKEQYKTTFKGTNRNDLCPCGSGKKYKKCCQSKFSNLRF